MKQLTILLQATITFLSISCIGQNNGKPDVFQKTNDAVNKVSNVIAVFQPYLLKAREIYYDAKQLAGDVKNAAKSSLGKNGNTNNTVVNGGTIVSNNQSGYVENSTNNNTTQNQGNTNGNGYNNSNQNGNTTNGNGYVQNVQNYLPNQNLPINNPSSVNNDGTGNWGNQNNGLYGNCLDALTGTVMGMGDAAQKPSSVDLMFFAPADGQNVYYLMTPGFARNNSTATYMTQHTSDQVLQWSDVNESEVALTKLTLSQFDRIQNNGQILSAVRNAQGYAGYITNDQKLDGQVFALRAQMDNREVYALIAVVRQIGTSGSNGYLKIKIKAQGIDSNGNNDPDANNYIR